jgi:endonuclease YncB( thermonuclease family)
MELRSDIAAAAARMTSAYDVNREIRHLAAYLREGETVQRLASGVYGAGAGLLAVTDHRVLLLRDGRSGHASEGFPVERLSSTEWVVDGGRGTITVSDSNSVAELREVPLADGEEVVGFIRALMNRGDAGSSRPRRWPGMLAAVPTGRPDAPGSLPVRANGNGRPSDPSAPYTSPSLPRVPVPPLNLPRRVVPAAATTFTESAVPVTLLSRTSTIPSQQPSAESSAPLAAAGRHTEAVSPPSATLPSAVTPSAGGGRTTMPPTASTGTQATMPPIAPATMPPAAPAADAAGVQATGPASAHAAPDAPVTTALGAPAGTGSVPPVNATPGAPAHGMSGYPTTVVPRVPPAQEQLPPAAQPMLGGHGQHSDTIGVPSMFAGEVPVSQLAAEETATQIAVPPRLLGGAEMAATTTMISAVGKADTQRAEPTATEQSAMDGEAGQRPQPIVWRVPDQTMTGAVRRIRAETAEAIRPRRFEAKYKPATGTRPKKWVWLGAGAAALVALVAVGGTKLLAQQHNDAAAPVNPAPAAVDSPTGQKATVTKVLDGDTVEVAGSEVNGTVEVLGIVAPRVDKNQCGAAAAKTFALHTLENTPVTLVSDASQPATSRTGHRLAFLKLPDGSDYSVLATQEGMTRFYDSPQAAKMASDIKAAEAEAQGRHVGLWGSPCNLKAPASGAGTTSTSGGNASPATTTG